MHVVQTLRLGGIGIFTALALMCAVVPFETELLAELLMSSTPLLVIGILEDIGISQPPRRRLMAAAFSGSLLILYTGLHLGRIGIPLADPLLSFLPLAAIFTLFATTGLTHAFNLIDGLNGLAGIISLACVCSLYLIANEAGELTVGLVALFVGAAIFGFLLFNLPLGWMFLGDTGAYGIGYMLGWLAIALVSSVPDLSPWAILLVFFWPVAETIFSIVRRKMKGIAHDRADRLHFHHVVLRFLELRLMRHSSRRVTNPLATLVMLPMVVAPTLCGAAVWNNNLAAFILVVLFTALFSLTYAATVIAAKRSLRRRVSHIPGIYKAAARRSQSNVG